MFQAALLLLVPLPQQPDAATHPPSEAPAGDLVVELTEGNPEERGLRWSPKAATVPLTPQDGKLLGGFPLGPEGAAPVRVELRRTDRAEHWDLLALDADRDGVFAADEIHTTTPSQRRDKFWSSFTATVEVPTVGPDGKPVVQHYPMALWFVFDTFEPDAPPALRWSRRGWMQGTARRGDDTVVLLVTEMTMDGVYDQRDGWHVATSLEEALGSADYPSTSRHAWLGEQAWRLIDLHPSGMRATLRPYDPGMTRAEERAANDRDALDRGAPRAEQPLVFGHDYAVAMAAAKEQNRPVFLDFETTWCGPCKTMDAIVYTAKPVVDAATANAVLPVKLDGDVERELVKQYKVEAYPTLILLDAEGKELRRAVGYRGVAAMKEFLTVGSRD